MLYIVGTPIGNIEDISYRAVKTLHASEIILAEDTRSAGVLLQRIEDLFAPLLRDDGPITKRHVYSYYKDKELEKLPQILEWLKDGKHISLISEAGMPCISDPGYLLVRAVIREEVPYTVIPGPTAAITALIHSGFKADTHMFLGFLPKKPGEIKKLLKKMQDIKAIIPATVFIAYESPHRIESTMKLLEDTMPEAEVVLARELTKKFEEILRHGIHGLQEVKGELCLVIS